MTPEVALLTLHAHQHTEEKEYTGVVIEVEHIHCHTVDIYNCNFLPSDHIDFESLLPPQSSTYRQSYTYVRKFTFPNNTYLRGPPTS